MTRVFFILLLAVSSFGQALFPNGLTRFAGADLSNYTGDGGPAYYAAFSGAWSVARDSVGNLYVVEASRIRKIDTHGIVSTFVSNVTANGIAVDSTGAIYISKSGQTIQRIGTGGVMTTIAGSGQSAYNGEAVAALSAGMAPSALAVDAIGQIYFADATNYRVRMIRTDGKVYTVAGTGVAGSAGENGPATQAQLFQPNSVALDAAGNLYIADPFRVVKVDARGTLTRFAGTGFDPPQYQAGGQASQTGITAHALATDNSGDVFIASGGPVFEVTPDGILHVFAGAVSPPAGAVCGDALRTILQASAIALDQAGNAYILNFNETRYQIYQATVAGALKVIAGMGPNLFTGDGGPATAATFASPTGIAFDAAGRLYIADVNNNRVRRIDTNGVVTTVAGAEGPTYDQDPACVSDSDNALRHPSGVALDAAGNLYIADSGKNRIRKVAADGTESTVFGGGSVLPGVASGAALSTAPGVGPGVAPNIASGIALNFPTGVAVDASGALYIADAGNGRLLKVGANGEGLSALSVAANGSLAFDGDGNLIVPTAGEVFLLRKSDGALLPIAGAGESGTRLQDMQSVLAAVGDLAGSIFTADSGAGIVQRTSPHCTMTTDGKAQLQTPAGLAFDAQGNLYVSDATGRAIWKAMPSPAPATESPTPALRAYHPLGNAAPALPPQVSQPEPFSPLPIFTQEPAAPGELVNVFGACIGPFDPVAADFDANGNLPKSLAGVSLSMNGIAMPLLSVSEGRAVAQVPFEETPVDATTGRIQVTYGGVTADSIAPVVALYPALFTVNGSISGQAVAVNADSSANSAANPAHAATVIALFASGLGALTPAGITGQAAPSNAPSQTAAPVTVTVGGAAAQVLFAGEAPGFAGLMQINIVIPSNAGSGPAAALPITLKVGGVAARQSTVTVYVAQ